MRKPVLVRVVLTSMALLCAAVPARADAERREPSVHVVARGQTLGRIAKRYHTTVDALRAVNHLPRRSPLKPGQRLVIPARGYVPEPGWEDRLRPATAAAGRAEAPEAGDAARGATRRDKGGAAGAPRSVRERDYAAKPKRPGVVRFVRGGEKFEGRLLQRGARLAPGALQELSRLLRYSPTQSHRVDPRLATLLGLVSDRFGGRTLEIVSGYRPYSPRQFTPHSKHNHGRAVDFRVHGVPNSVVRDYCRTFRNAGVGYYPNSTFIHLDVRDRKTYWVDYSRPGEPPRYDSPAHRHVADEAAAEVEAEPRHDEPPEEELPRGDPYGSTQTLSGSVQQSENP